MKGSQGVVYEVQKENKKGKTRVVHRNMLLPCGNEEFKEDYSRPILKKKTQNNYKNKGNPIQLVHNGPNNDDTDNNQGEFYPNQLQKLLNPTKGGKGTTHNGKMLDNTDETISVSNPNEAEDDIDSDATERYGEDEITLHDEEDTDDNEIRLGDTDDDEIRLNNSSISGENSDDNEALSNNESISNEDDTDDGSLDYEDDTEEDEKNSRIKSQRTKKPRKVFTYDFLGVPTVKTLNVHSQPFYPWWWDCHIDYTWDLVYWETYPCINCGNLGVGYI